MDTMLSGPEFAIAYLEDILLKSENPEHKKNVFKVFRRIQDYGKTKNANFLWIKSNIWDK